MRRWWLRAVVSVAVVAVLLTFVPIDEVWGAIRGASPWVWAASVGVFIAGHALNAVKLWLLIGPAHLPAVACLRAQFAAIASNLGLPGVAGGEVIRVTYLAPTAGTARVAMAAVADRMVDAGVLVLLAAGSVAAAGLPPAIAASVTAGGRWLAGVVLAVALAAIAIRRWLRRTGAWSHVQETSTGILARPGAVGLAAGLSLSVQTTFVLTNVWLASEVGVTTAVAPWFLAWTVAKLSALLPISLGGIGVREAALVSVLAAYGAPADRVLAAGILWQGALIAGSAGGFLGTQLLRR
jgi:glycosyltransferase 2 family protein